MRNVTLSEKDKEILEIRKGFIDKICSWESKIFYGLLGFFGSVIIAMISNKAETSNVVYVGLFGLILLTYTEFTSWQRINRLHRALLKDFEKGNLGNLKDYSFCDYLKNRF